MKWRTPTELVGRLTARQRIAGGVAWHTTPPGGNNAVHPVNVPDCGWIIGKYVQGQATGAVGVWYVTQHVNVANRKTYKIPPLNFCGQTPHPEQDAAAANNTFAGAHGEYDSPALRTNFADAARLFCQSRMRLVVSFASSIEPSVGTIRASAA